MRTIRDHIERVKGHPHHVRKRVAFASAAILTALIALVWLAVSVGTGAFALGEGSFAGSLTPEGVIPTDGGRTGSRSAVSGVAGVSAASALPQAENVPAYIEIIDASSPTAGQKQAEQTTIPF